MGSWSQIPQNRCVVELLVLGKERGKYRQDTVKGTSLFSVLGASSAVSAKNLFF